MFAQRKPDPLAARRELRRNVGWFLLAVAAIRAVPYVLDAAQKA